MKTLPPKPQRTLNPKFWQGFAEYREFYDQEDLVDTVDDLYTLWRGIKWKIFTAETYADETDPAKVEKHLANAERTWKKRIQGLHKQADLLERRANAMLKVLPAEAKQVRAPVTMLLKDLAQFRKDHPAAFDDDDFLELIAEIRGGSKKKKKKGGEDDDDDAGGGRKAKGGKKGAAALDDDDDDDDKKKKPADPGGFRKAAAALANTCKQSAAHAKDIARTAPQAPEIIAAQNQKQRGQGRTIKGLLPVGGDTLAKRLAKGMTDDEVDKFTSKLPGGSSGKLAKSLLKAGFGKGANDDAKRKLKSIADTLVPAANKMSRAVSVMYGHVGTAKKTAKGNDDLKKGLEDADKLLDILSRIADDSVTYAAAVQDAVDLMEDGKPLSSVRLNKLDGDRLVKGVVLLERWATGWQRMV
ncbi:hypothetical protein [Caenispirillum bisanense]|uniref:hypothetical protein n=1 Tax=Caenispirillum bisanense TaxID=414052 RepID=UPI0031D8E023